MHIVNGMRDLFKIMDFLLILGKTEKVKSTQLWRANNGDQ